MKNEPQPPRKAAERRDDSLTKTSFLPPPRERPGMLRGWENHIEVERNGDRLVIVGTNPDNAPPVDLLDYLKWYVWAPTLEREAKGIHLEFINAWSDSSLLAFIRKWGPITAPYFRHIDGSKIAVESFRQIRSLQAVLAASIRLFRISCQDSPATAAALEAMNHVIATMQIARQDAEFAGDSAIGLMIDCEVISGEARKRQQRSNLTDNDLRELCHDILCAICNRYPSVLIATKEGVLDAPAAQHGLLPLLFFLLREDLVRGRKIVQCEQDGNYFLERRRGERGCSPECKNRIRAKLHYRQRKAAIELHAKGVPLPEISRQLGVPVEKLAKWLQR